MSGDAGLFKLRKIILEQDNIFDYLSVICEMLLTEELVLRERGIASTRELAYIWYEVRRRHYGNEKVSPCRKDMDTG